MLDQCYSAFTTQTAEQPRANPAVNMPERVEITAWLMDSESEDQRLPHKRSPCVCVHRDQLESIGIVAYKYDADNYEKDLKDLRAARGYNFSDEITISKNTLPNYEEKIKIFFTEHLHTDEEVRFIIDGSGYFDVRNANDKWIRILVQKGDLMILIEMIFPKGSRIELRFSVNVYILLPHIFTPYCQDTMGIGRRQFLAYA